VLRSGCFFSPRSSSSELTLNIIVDKFRHFCLQRLNASFKFSKSLINSNAWYNEGFAPVGHTWCKEAVFKESDRTYAPARLVTAMAHERRDWPVVSLADAYRVLTTPGAPFEMETIDVDGRPVRVYKKAYRDLRTIFDSSLAWKDRTFIVYGNERLSFHDHYRAASALAWRLAEDYGVKKSDRVAIAMRNYPEWPIAFWATTVIGAVAVPLNAWGTGADLAYGLGDSGARVAIVDGERLERLNSLPPDECTSALIAVRTPRDKLGAAMALEDLIGCCEDYKALPDRAPPDRDIEPDDDATILYTSGTTGRPKGALGTHRNIACNLVNITFAGARAAIRRGDLCPLLRTSRKRSCCLSRSST